METTRLIGEEGVKDVGVKADVEREDEGKGKVGEGMVARAFLPLGFVAFGGPQAHVALLHQQFVKTVGDLTVSEELFLELFALAQALPGPSSTQLVVLLGIVMGGWLGGIIAFFVFQIPGFVAMTSFGLLLGSGGNSSDILRTISLFTHGLIAAAFAQVTIAAGAITLRVTGHDQFKRVIALFSTVVATVAVPSSVVWMYPLILFSGGLAAYVRDLLSGADVRAEEDKPEEQTLFHSGISKKAGYFLLGLFTVTTLACVIFINILGWTTSRYVQLFDAFWRMGALVFGGGQVVLPMMMNEVVERAWMTYDVFLNGFALVQVMPGPLFNLAPFVGAAMLGLPGALIAAVGMFAPGVSLIFAVLPFWADFRKTKLIKVCLSGVTAAAAGLINSAVYIFLMKSISSKAAYAIAVLTAGFALFFGYAAPVTILGGGVLGSIFIALNIGGPFCGVFWWTSRIDPDTLAQLCPAL